MRSQRHFGARFYWELSTNTRILTCVRTDKDTIIFSSSYALLTRQLYQIKKSFDRLMTVRATLKIQNLLFKLVSKMETVIFPL